MMSTVIMDVSEKLGQYMLNGWVLTDHPCTAAATGCRVPLLRSPTTPPTYYCANCDENKTIAPPIPSPTASSSSHLSRCSTPPTEISSRASSPAYAPPPETAESLLRRQQSDAASSEIGKRLLKGWAMLAEECPSNGCFGVPLVRPPKPGGSKDPKKECVICGTVYISETDSNGRERLVSLDATVATPTQSKEDAVASSVVPPSTTTFLAKDKGKGRAPEKEATKEFRSEPPLPGRADNESRPGPSFSLPHDLFATPQSQHAPAPQNTSVLALEASAISLELALHTLSEKLTVLSSGKVPLDPPSIVMTADAIGKVSEALAKVKQLHWSESRVG